MKLIVLNLPRSLSEVDFAKLFKKFGEIKSSNLVYDQQNGNSKGFGFIEMAQASDAENAIKELNGRLVEGKKIRVKAAN
jgi:RNA recognition motif-containing protein